MRLVCSALLFILSLTLPGCAEPAVDLHDGLGREVDVEPPVRRVVTLAPNVTELVHYAGGGPFIVGTDSLSDYPPSVAGLPKVGGLQPSVERIAALRPELAFASTSGNPASLAEGLAAAGIPLYAVRADRVMQYPNVVRELAALFGVDGNPQAEALEMELAAQRRTRDDAPKVLVVLWPEPLYVAGRDTFIDDLLEIAGAENSVPTTGWPSWSLEALVSEQPDLIIVPAPAVTRERILELRRRDGAWKHVRAVGRGEVYEIDEDVFLRPGPRVVDGLRALNAILDRREAAR